MPQVLQMAGYVVRLEHLPTDIFDQDMTPVVLEPKVFSIHILASRQSSTD